MSMSLTALPPELISCVVASIASGTTLCNLARCSHQLYLYTVPHLYRHVTIWEEIEQGEQRNGQLRGLASVLIRRSDLAALVRHFTLHDPRYSLERGQFSEKLQIPTESKDHVKLDLDSLDIDTLSSLSAEEKVYCLRQISYNHESYHDFILALLLPALLNVEKLVLDLKIMFVAHYLDQMIPFAASRTRLFDIQLPFEALTTFVFSHDMFSPRSTGFLASLLKLPAIQQISGYFTNTCLGEDDDHKKVMITDRDLIELDNSSSPLISLDLAALDNRDTAHLGHILRAPKALKAFSYKVYGDSFINFTDVRHALGPHENCLESLGFDCDLQSLNTLLGVNEDSDDDWDSEDLEPITSFISFNALKVFKIAAHFLVTDNETRCNNLVDIFPSSLETLHLTRFESRFESLLEALEHLLAHKSPQQTPALKNLILEEITSFRVSLWRPWSTVKLMDVLWRGTQETAIGRLISVAAAQGVSVDVIEASTD
ncbi:hypothetical protein MMC22_004906 [Lobaria immixta]|nr:hypothetical protein [Lobaria immixta]